MYQDTNNYNSILEWKDTSHTIYNTRTSKKLKE